MTSIEETLEKQQAEIKELVRRNARLDFETELLRAAKNAGDLDILQFALDFVEGNLETRCACGGTKLPESEVCKDCI